MGDDRIVISSGQVLTPEMVMSRDFSSAFRGYHPAEVRQFLKRVSDEMAASAGREVELRRALQEALARAAHPDLDEATVTDILGEHAARLLAGARDTALSITSEAREQAEAAQRDADLRFAGMAEEADGLLARRVAEADASAASIRQAAEAKADAQIESATEQGRDMVAEARAVRERMLGDLTRRRRVAQVQIEQLRAARERLVAAYEVVRRTVDEATAELDSSESEARLAAEAVARRAEEPDGAEWPEPSPQPVPTRPAQAEGRPVSLVPEVAATGVADRRQPPVPAGPLLRAVEEKAPPAPERPRLRPQTVADAAAGRMPAPASAPLPAAAPADVASASPPPAPFRLPEPTSTVPDKPVPARRWPVPAPVSELATSEVPVVAASDPPGTVAPGDPPGTVDELFARIRADRRSVDFYEPLTGLSEPAPSPPLPDAPSVDAVVSENALEGRDDLLDNLEAGLTRALKRVLGDEQNEVLDGLRRLGSSSGREVLPESAAQTASYRDAATPWLQQAARAGIGFVCDPGSGTDAEKAHPSLDSQAVALACELVEPLRERLTRALDGDVDDPSVVAERLRATYRQWKIQQVEECARHHVVTAFNAGAFAATPDVATLQWLVDDDGHCPDCDDNALAGPTTKGQPFPTGQLHPPAHPGCRCLLVPITA